MVKSVKIAVTGSSSYLAKNIIPLLIEDNEVSEVLGIDLQEYSYDSSKFSFIKSDIRNPDLWEDMKGFDCIIHLAFIVSPIEDVDEIYSINVDGSKNIFDCAIEAGIKKIVHASSVAAYGAFPDNPAPIKEDHPIRVMDLPFYYNETKVLVEQYLDILEKKYPEIIITRLRPHIFLGPHINNFFQNSFTSRISYSFYPENLSQYVWSEDVARAFYLSAKKEAHGAFNLACDEPISSYNIAKLLNRRVIRLPFHLTVVILKLLSKLGLIKKPLLGWLYCTKYPIVVDNQKAKNILGWKPIHNTTLDTIISFLKLKQSGKN